MPYVSAAFDIATEPPLDEIIDSLTEQYRAEHGGSEPLSMYTLAEGDARAPADVDWSIQDVFILEGLA